MKENFIPEDIRGRVKKGAQFCLSPEDVGPNEQR